MEFQFLDKKWSLDYEETKKCLILLTCDDLGIDLICCEVELLQMINSTHVKIDLKGNRQSVVYATEQFQSNGICSAYLNSCLQVSAQHFIIMAKQYPDTDHADSVVTVDTMTYREPGGNSIESCFVGRYEIPICQLNQPENMYEVRNTDPRRVIDIKEALISSGQKQLTSQLTVIVHGIDSPAEFETGELGSYMYFVIDGNHRFRAMTEIRKERDTLFDLVDCRVYAGLSQRQALCLGYRKNTSEGSILKMSEYDTICFLRKLFGDMPLPNLKKGMRNEKLEEVYSSLNITKRKEKSQIQPLRFIAGMTTPMFDIAVEAVKLKKCSASALNCLRNMEENKQHELLQKWRESNFENSIASKAKEEKLRKNDECSRASTSRGYHFSGMKKTKTSSTKDVSIEDGKTNRNEENMEDGSSLSTSTFYRTPSPSNHQSMPSVKNKKAQASGSGNGRPIGALPKRAGKVQTGVTGPVPILVWEEFDEQQENANANQVFGGALPGPTRIAERAQSVEDHFRLFINEGTWVEWCNETNRYAEVTRELKQAASKWTPVTPEEMKAHVGLCIAMGIVKLPSITDYFTEEPILCHPWFSSIMSRDRFVQISSYLHICDEAMFPHDKLGKIRNLINLCSRRFPQMWNLHKNVCIDEQLIGSRNRIGFIQYLPKKPVKFGVKVWVLADSVVPYVTDFQVYTGKDERTAEFGLANRVVNDLMKNHRNKGHNLFTDNFYSNPSLFLDLEKEGIYATGTVRQDRKGMPCELKVKNLKLERGQSVFLKTGSLTSLRWKDKRDVFCISTTHGNQLSEEFPHKPQIIVDYNHNMNGVDRNDQLLSYYTLNRSCRKWWKKVFWRLIELCIINGYLIYNFRNQSKLTHKQFRLQLVYSLVQPLLDARTEGRMIMGPGRPSLPFKRLQGKHFPTAGKKGDVRGRCKVCARQKKPNGKTKDTKTATRCEKCPGKPFLCQGVCFQAFHTQGRLSFANEC